ncbi:MAG: hypothetical protein ACKPKO_62520, partial [Candidatus Fonsibacter sp.]
AVLRRVSICIPDSTSIPSGPKYFVVASLDQSPQGVRFRLPKGHKDKETIGMNNPLKQKLRKMEDREISGIG